MAATTPINRFREDISLKAMSEHWDKQAQIEVAPIDVPAEVAKFPLIPVGERIFVIEEVVTRVGKIEMPDTFKQTGEMQTNIGWVIAVGDEVTLCKVGDRVFYGRYSGAWVVDKTYRVMNQEDLLGVFKEGADFGKKG